jgi:hypothetical protein
MERSKTHAATDDPAEKGESGSGPNEAMSDEAAKRALDQGDNAKIDRALDELDVSTTESGKDQSAKPDTEGSNSSSKNLDEQGD